MYISQNQIFFKLRKKEPNVVILGKMHIVAGVSRFSVLLRKFRKQKILKMHLYLRLLSKAKDKQQRMWKPDRYHSGPN